jgi:hypothetical protein
MLHGVRNSKSGEGVLLIPNEGGQETQQHFRAMMRAHGRGWQIVLFADRGSPHTAEARGEVAAA